MWRLMFIFTVIFSFCCEASAGRKEGDCSYKGVSIEYQGLRKVEVWGRAVDLALFRLGKNSDGEMMLPLDRAENPIMLHGAHVELQSRLPSSSEEWGADAIVLEHFVPPTEWLVIGKGGSAEIFVDVAGALDDRGRSREFRLFVKDSAGCQHFSRPFRVEIAAEARSGS